MRDLDKALADINAIKSQMARDTEFRGYGPATFATTGLLASLAAFGQAVWLPTPAQSVATYMTIWVIVAGVSIALIGVEMVARSRRIHSGLAEEMIHAAVQHFLPAGVSGALLTLVLIRFAPQSLWMIPGLWQMVFGLGVFASCRFLPRPMALVGIWYVGAGLACLAFANGASAFSPWAMGAGFGIGQALVALILLRNAGGEDGRG
jgi:hypothetical protein